MIRKILVPVRGDGKAESVIVYAAVLAKAAKSHIEVTHCRARPEDLMPYGVPIPKMLRKQMLEQASSIADAEEQVLKDEFEALAKKAGIEIVSGNGGDGPSAEWVEEAGRQVDVIRQHGRLADVIVVPKPDIDRNLGTNTLKAALFNTGRPVLMVPDKKDAPKSLGQNVTIAWNGSLESSRAVTMTLPILRSAKSVTILSSGGEPAAASAEKLQEYLRAHEIESTISRFSGSGNVGKTLLSLSTELGADCLIMGAYGDSHERETVFGGNTQHVVDKAVMPVILVH
jgi:nucleotide-binding universal stress UspA family protein